MLTILIILLILAIVFGGIGYSSHGPVAASPLVIIIVILAILYFTGAIR